MTSAVKWAYVVPAADSGDCTRSLRLLVFWTIGIMPLNCVAFDKSLRFRRTAHHPVAGRSAVNMDSIFEDMQLACPAFQM